MVDAAQAGQDLGRATTAQRLREGESAVLRSLEIEWRRAADGVTAFDIGHEAMEDRSAIGHRQRANWNLAAAFERAQESALGADLNRCARVVHGSHDRTGMRIIPA